MARAELFARTAAASLEIASAATGTANVDTLTTRIGSLLRGTLTNAKPPSRTGTWTAYLNDTALDDLWLLIVWSE
ncbi:MAG TPA: hypothetical protein VFB92_20935 [Vicinamibacterales bacterium]|nr:hypothetical protein [Vicinamibacterales bacterium]